jgi:hypothetical protein
MNNHGQHIVECPIFFRRQNGNTLSIIEIVDDGPPHSLVIFAIVVEASGFSEATRRLKIPISTVGRSGADIENLFGVCLLARSTRNYR